MNILYLEEAMCDCYALNERFISFSLSTLKVTEAGIFKSSYFNNGRNSGQIISCSRSVAVGLTLSVD